MAGTSELTTCNEWKHDDFEIVLIMVFWQLIHINITNICLLFKPDTTIVAKCVDYVNNTVTTYFTFSTYNMQQD